MCIRDRGNAINFQQYLLAANTFGFIVEVVEDYSDTNQPVRDKFFISTSPVAAARSDMAATNRWLARVSSDSSRSIGIEMTWALNTHGQSVSFYVPGSGNTFVTLPGTATAPMRISFYEAMV